MAVTVTELGVLDGVPVRAFALSAGGVVVDVIEYGARLWRCLVPDAVGSLADVALGFDTLEDYVSRGGSTGAICGRYGNRIAGGRFSIDGTSYHLPLNEPPNSLHGGFRQYAKHIWRGETLGDDAVRLRLVSPDGDEGYPGTLAAEVTYRLTADPTPELRIAMRATTDKATYVNLIYHGYWNLAGHASGSVDDHLLQVAADTHLPLTADKIPTGERTPVAGTPFDFRAPRRIGERIAVVAPGYDNNLCLGGEHAGATRPVLRLADPKSGRAIELSTNQPGVQFYTANQWANPTSGKDGATYHAHQGAAFETQLFPNAPNIPAFDPRPLRPREVYSHDMLVRFTAHAPADLPGFFDRLF